ncbi:penicillin acylase family protein [Actinopolymorpha singaporensis]|uniref:Penicillin amidase n=1 Tax=Actinopolymorpha singaporensis TaxID=117157 RepID=A0A1H1YY83_9ACTN|nr:penicillin acylase family protein [Actinopolymorpha singaporensis]SDT26373.1 penicillin amidase [Actinopolymorpha singaporensis]
MSDVSETCEERSVEAVSGLSAPVEIVVDTWGVPHIYAESADDVFFAQGFNAARDRLFQIDLWRRRGLGRLAEAFGPDHLERDRAARLFLYRGDLDAEWASYGTSARATVTRFVEGVNAYLDWLERHPEELPPEFGMLDYRPARWSPEDVVRIRSHGTAYNLLQEVARARVTHVGGWESDLVRQSLRPHRQPHLADGLDLDLPDDVLRVYELATTPVVFTGDSRVPLSTELPADNPAKAAAAGATAAAARDLDGGSNNWVVAGSRTATGRPILASDPHRPFATPSLRYFAHLSAPGLDVIGAGEPAVPGVTLGHNGHVAFGYTIFPIDTVDLYVYDLDPDDPTRYRYGNGWESMRIERETAQVRDAHPCQLELAFTRHGPVIHVDSEHLRAYAVRTTWFEPGTAAYLGSLEYLRARDGEEFRAALRAWGGPGENHVFADTAGHVGWQAAGLVPRRTGWDGLLPVPGDGRYEWTGFHAPEELPGLADPPAGFVATANEYNLPPDYPADRQLSYEWSDPARQRRIVEVLERPEPHRLEDSMRLQTDWCSVGTREVLALVAGLPPNGDRRLAAALAMLRDWDGVEAPESAAAALYQVWFSRHLLPGFAEAVLPPGVPPLLPTFDQAAVRSALSDPATVWSGEGDGEAERRRDDLLLGTLRAAVADLEELLGPDPRGWSWGALHRNHQPHPLGFLDPKLDVGPFPAGGSATTLNAAPYLPGDFVQTIGASARVVVDVGEWDNSVFVNTPGQSGDPRSPHYRDLAELWRAGELAPLLYSRAAVERSAKARIRLLPG